MALPSAGWHDEIDMPLIFVFPVAMLTGSAALPLLLKKQLQPFSLLKLILVGLVWSLLCSAMFITAISLSNYPYYSADPTAWGEVKAAAPQVIGLWGIIAFPTYAGLAMAYLYLKKQGKVAQSPFAARPGIARLASSATTAILAGFALWVIAAMVFITYGFLTGKID